MKRLFGLGALALSLSSCLVVFEPDPSTVTQPAVTSASFATDFFNEAKTEYYACAAKNDAAVTINLSWTGDMESFRVELFGENAANGTPPKTSDPSWPKYSFGVNASERTTKTATRTFIYRAADIHPLRDSVTTQAVIVTPAPGNTPLGATKLRIVASDVLNRSSTFVINNQKILILGDQSPQCQ
jgi:hypothetical protein